MQVVPFPNWEPFPSLVRSTEKGVREVSIYFRPTSTRMLPPDAHAEGVLLHGQIFPVERRSHASFQRRGHRTRTVRDRAQDAANCAAEPRAQSGIPGRTSPLGLK
ncbi:gTP cyclohydrolase II [Anopheles sinensis]|uniref:GTP cyclohydrolase II n=1 Tax=Anopheles sinensis TaxID=74873 RepID=A0A084VU96_ANOSI|nr:gTP cyclohydrolase II [Anopheles sinensis]